MATKMIGFRLSGDHLEKAQEILGSDITGINKKAQELMIAFLTGKITIITEPDTEPVETLPPDLINGLTDKIRELEDQINQINQNNKETTDRLNDLENKITTANSANTANSLDIVPSEAVPDTTDRNINHTANTANTPIIRQTANTANTANSPNNTEKIYRHKLLEHFGISTKASKDQIIPKLKKLGVIVDRNSETFYQDACNQLGIV